MSPSYTIGNQTFNFFRMKRSYFKVFGILAVAGVVLTSCDGLGKMVKHANTIQYTVTPNPLTLQGDSIAVTIAGKYPAKYFAKKAVVTVTPVLKYNGAEKALKSVTAIGEKAVGTGTKVAYETGGSFSYTTKVGYEKGIENATLELKATGSVKKKSKDFPQTKVADGTIVTQLLFKNDEKPVFAKDAFVKTKPVSANSTIYYVISQSAVRPTEMKSKEMKEFTEFIEKGLKNGVDFKNVSISAYASPDGELNKNNNLANDRAETASKALMELFKEKKTKYEAASKSDFYTKIGKGEDWDGFKDLMEKSDIKDKELILRVLTMYSDPEQREKEIENMSKSFTEVAEKILPKLRRSMITLNGEEKSRSDEEILKLANATPDSLSLEELLYAAGNLTKDLGLRLNLYKTAEKNFASDWRGSNNAGVIYLMQNKASDAAAEFEKAAAADSKNAIVKNNQGIVASWKGDRKKATELYKAAAGAGPEVSYNLGILEIQNGNYAAAVSDFGSYNTFNVALAKVLNGSADAGAQVIDASDDKDAAVSYYLKAVIGARTAKTDMVINNLRIALNKDASLKDKAKNDAEFLKLRDNADFKSLTN